MSRAHKPTPAQARGMSAFFLLAQARKEARRRKERLRRRQVQQDYPELVREQNRRSEQRKREGGHE